MDANDFKIIADNVNIGKASESVVRAEKCFENTLIPRIRDRAENGYYLLIFRPEDANAPKETDISTMTALLEILIRHNFRALLAKNAARTPGGTGWTSLLIEW